MSPFQGFALPSYVVYNYATPCGLFSKLKKFIWNIDYGKLNFSFCGVVKILYNIIGN